MVRRKKALTLSDKIDSLMMKVTKPVRYVGGEFGSVSYTHLRKSPELFAVAFCVKKE